MSAIVAAAGRRLSKSTRQWLVEATAYSAHAGPDRQEVAFGARWGLGHALLQTGVDGPGQPLTRDGRVWLTADVRLDGRAELLSSLLAHGQPVDAGATDPELLLAAYLAWDSAFLERVAGDFAFALWDDRQGRLVCGRDQIGVAPLHYARVGDELLVATALNALLLHPAVSDELDENAISDFLVMGRGDFTGTSFRAIRRLAPAHNAILDGPDLRLRRYWHQPEWPPLVRFKTPDEYVTRFRSLLETAIADRITSDRLAVHVSGGMDSTTVAAIARQVMSGRGLPDDAIRGATMVLGGDTGDEEGRYAGLIGRSLGLELEIVDESSFQATDPFEEPQLPSPEPLPYQWTAMAYESALRSSRQSRVLLTGLPGDSLAMFIPWYWAEWLTRGRVVRLAHALADNARVFGSRPHPDLRRSTQQLWAVLRRPAAQLPGWLARGFADRTGAAGRAGALGVTPARLVDVRSVGGVPFWTALFGWGDPTFTGLPLRLRHPLADLRLLNFAARLPPEPWLIKKRILREATADLLPDAVRTRPKTPLVRARRAFITSEVLAGLAELVRTTHGLEQFFDLDALRRAITTPGAALDHPDDHTLMRALGLAYWYAHWRRPTVAGPAQCDVLITSQIEEAQRTHGHSTGPTSARLH